MNVIRNENVKVIWNKNVIRDKNQIQTNKVIWKLNGAYNKNELQ